MSIPPALSGIFSTDHSNLECSLTVIGIMRLQSLRYIAHSANMTRKYSLYTIPGSAGVNIHQMIISEFSFGRQPRLGWVWFCFVSQPSVCFSQRFCSLYSSLKESTLLAPIPAQMMVKNLSRSLSIKDLFPRTRIGAFRKNTATTIHHTMTGMTGSISTGRVVLEIGTPTCNLKILQQSSWVSVRSL